MMRSRKLHIFTREGSTFTFFYGEILVDNETSLVFSYHAQSDGGKKVAHFIKANIAGYSCQEGNEIDLDEMGEP